MLNKEQIQQLLPHRDAMLLIDSAELRDETAYASKTIVGDEWFLQGHFPGNPIVPGVIQCEILAQSACVLLAAQMSEACTTLFTSLNNVRFKRPVRPGEVFQTECRLIKHKHPFYWAAGKGYVQGELCVSAEFSFALMPSASETTT